MSQKIDLEAVEKMLSGLLGREVMVAAKPAPKPAELKIAGFYRNGDGQPVAACLADISAAAFSGSALSLIPAASAKDFVKSGVIDDEDVRDNFYEVLNICSRLFAEEDAQRVTLDTVYFPPETVPADQTSTLSKSRQRNDLEITVDGYGKGRLALLRL